MRPGNCVVCDPAFETCGYVKTLMVMVEEKKVKEILVETSSNCSTLEASLPVRRTLFFSLWLPKVNMCLKATRGHLKKKMTPDQLRSWSSLR